MTYDVFQTALRPKVAGSKNLQDLLSFANLDFFVMLSSSAGIVGNSSQCNYAASSAFQDAYAHSLTAKGLPVVTLDLGAIESVGFVAENPEYVANLERWGFLTISESEFLAILKSALIRPQRKLEDCQIITGLGTQGMVETGHGDTSDVPFWFHDAKFSHLLQLDRVIDKELAAGGITRLQDSLPLAASLRDASQLICESIVVKMSKMLVIPVENIDAGQSLASYGVDSLVAVELRNWLFREAKADVPVFELLGTSSLMALAEEVAVKSKLLSGSLLAEVEAE